MSVKGGESVISFGTDEIRQIVTQYGTTLYRVAFAALRSSADAEDVVQEVFLRLLESRPRWETPEQQKAWLIRVTINLSHDLLRRASRKDLPLEQCPELPQEDSGEADGELLPAVLALPEKYRTVIHLYYYEDYTIREIARILSLPAATVGTRLARARAILRKKLEGGFFDD